MVTARSLMPRSSGCSEAQNQAREHVPSRLLPKVVPKLKLAKVAQKVLRGNVNVSPADGALELRPVAFNAVGMDCAPDVLPGAMLDGVVVIAALGQCLCVKGIIAYPLAGEKVESLMPDPLSLALLALAWGDSLPVPLVAVDGPAWRLSL